MDINQIVITPEILTLIAEIDEFKGSWRSLKTLAPEKLATFSRWKSSVKGAIAISKN